MANRFPLIVDSSAQQIKELAASDNIDLTSSGIVNATSIASTSFSGTHITLSGVATASSFVGNLTGTATGLSGTPNVTVGVVTASSVSVSGNVSIAGTLTYEDVTNVDSIGLVTARTGVRITNGGLVVTSGVSTISGGLDLSSLLREGVNIVAGKLSDNTNINLDNGMVHFFTTTETTTSRPNIFSSVGINTQLAVGETSAVTIITTAAAGLDIQRVLILMVLTTMLNGWVVLTHQQVVQVAMTFTHYKSSKQHQQHTLC